MKTKVSSPKKKRKTKKLYSGNQVEQLSYVNVIPMNRKESLNEDHLDRIASYYAERLDNGENPFLVTEKPVKYNGKEKSKLSEERAAWKRMAGIAENKKPIASSEAEIIDQSSQTDAVEIKTPRQEINTKSTKDTRPKSAQPMQISIKTKGKKIDSHTVAKIDGPVKAYTPMDEIDNAIIFPNSHPVKSYEDKVVRTMTYAEDETIAPGMICFTNSPRRASKVEDVFIRERKVDAPILDVSEIQKSVSPFTPTNRSPERSRVYEVGKERSPAYRDSFTFSDVDHNFYHPVEYKYTPDDHHRWYIGEWLGRNLKPKQVNEFYSPIIELETDVGVERALKKETMYSNLLQGMIKDIKNAISL
jgi:hypothetical protein